MKKQLFTEYFEEWIKTYKEGVIRNITLSKYYVSLSQLKKIAPDLYLEEITRRDYQRLLNIYAETHEKATTMDFHHQMKSALQDAFHDGIINRDPTYKAVVKGKAPSRNKKNKFLSENDLSKLLSVLEVYDNKYDLLIFLLAKTGLRFAEAIGLTKADFDFENNIIDVNKTWDYKSKVGKFAPTKNPSSVRKVKVDKNTMRVFKNILKDKSLDEVFFVDKRIFNSTVNSRLEEKCKEAEIEAITAHALRHTHASVLLYTGVSIQSIANRLGHANTTTTQETYIHVIEELQEEDYSLIVEKMGMIG